MARILDGSAHARTRERILDAARGLFASEGYHASSMNDVARSSGLTKAGLYHYFESKHAILAAMHQALMAEAEARIDGFPRLDSLREALLEAGRQYLAHFRDPKHRQMMQIAFKLGMHELEDEDASAVFRDQRMDEKLLGIFGPYLPGTSKAQARLFAQQFFGGLFFLVFAAEQLCPATSIPSPEAYLEQLVQTFAAGAPAALKGAA
jgi:AcrR family transcriptional regulator